MSTRPAMERMSGIDATFLYMENPTVHMHTLKVAVLEADPGITFDFLVKSTMDRLDRLPPLRRKVVDVPFGFNHPLLVTQPHIDIFHHMRRHDLGGGATMRELEELVGTIASTPLNRAHPLWELHFCEGLEGGRWAVVVKMHHALADGAAANALLANVTDVRSAGEVEPAQDRYEATDRVPGKVRRFLRGWWEATLQLAVLPGLVLRTVGGVRRVRRVQASPDAVRMDKAPAVSFNGTLSARRSYATVSLPFAELKRIRGQHPGVTLNDVVLGMVSGALRRWMAEHGERPATSLRANVPSGADERGAAPRLGGNSVSNLFTTLATDVDDPAERLQVIARTTTHAKRRQEAMGAKVLADWSQFTPPRPFAAAMRAYSRSGRATKYPNPSSVIVSNVPGPREPVSVGGIHIADLFSVGPLIEGIGLNVTVWSYVDRMNFSLLACPDLLPDVELLASYLPDALAELDLSSAEGDVRRNLA